MKKIHVFLGAIGLLLSQTLDSQAAKIVDLNFDNYTAGAISGQNATGGEGLTGAWSFTGVTATDSLSIVSTAGGGKALSLQSAGITGSAAFGTVSLSNAITGTNVYLGLDFKVITPSTNVATRMFMGLAATKSMYSATNIANGLGVYGQNAGAGTNGIFTSATTLADSGVNISVANLSSRIVAEFIWNGTTSKYDTVKLWLNPLGTDDATPLITLAVDANGQDSSFGTLDIVAANLSGNPTMEYQFDNMIIGTTWQDVVVPEPSAMALVMAGGIGWFVASLRRKRHAILP